MTQKANYKAWSVSENDFPSNGSLEQKIHFIVQYGVLAPSTHNTQPWLIKIKDSIMTVRPDFTKVLPAGDPSNTGLLISIGAFVENIVQASGGFGLSTKATVFNNKVVLDFKVNRQSTTNKQTLNSITKRCSNKLWYAKSNKFEHKKLMDKLIVLQNQYLKVVHEDNQRDKVIRLHISAVKEAMKDKKFIYEVSKWLRRNSTKKYDGMPGFVQGHSKVKGTAGKFLARTLKMLPPSIIKYEEGVLQSTPFFVVFGSRSQKPSDIIRAGMLVERFWLTITEEGLVAQPLFAMIKSENYRLKLKKSVGMSTIPVFFLRVGAPKFANKHTPRRPYLWN